MDSGYRHGVKKLTRVGCCVELLLDVERPGRFVQVVVSIPNRPGTLTRTWSLNSNGSMDAAAYSDLITYVDELIVGAIAMQGGVQDRLPMQ